jgi:hypothetical protein
LAKKSAFPIFSIANALFTPMNALQSLSASTDLTLTHEQGQIHITGHSTGDGLLIRADSPRVLKAALRTVKNTFLKNMRWRSTLKHLRDSPQSIRLQVKDQALITIGKDRMQIRYFRLLPYLPCLL